MAFMITGIYPLNRSIIADTKFEPATNTTTEEVMLFPSQPPIIPITESPDLINVDAEDEPHIFIPNHTHQTAQTVVSNLPLPPAVSMYIGLPPALPNSSSKELFILQNQELRNITQTLYSQVQTDRMQLHICTIEIDRLWRLAYGNNDRKTMKAKLDGSGARHMTSEQALQALQDTEEQAKDKEQGKVQRAEDREKKKQAKQVQDEEKAAQKRATAEKRQQTAERRKEEAQRKALDSTIEKAFRGLVAAEKALIKASSQCGVAGDLQKLDPGHAHAVFVSPVLLLRRTRPKLRIPQQLSTAEWLVARVMAREAVTVALVP
ncbi:hypothetical protein IMY05_C1151000700 [Salix suchowensis]|nr:hypothetical protein IMY05_C1151000700 [Salix suchowensis]